MSKEPQSEQSQSKQPFSLPEGMTAEPATEEESRAAWGRGREAGADFVILSRERDEDGNLDEADLMVFSPEGNPMRKMFEDMAERGMAIRCTPMTRSERKHRETQGGNR